MALQLARSYHVERGEPKRWQVISPAQAYHGPTMQTLALTGRPGLQGPFGAVPPRAPAHPAELARIRPHRRSGARGARPRARAGRAGERVGVLLRGDQRRGAARLHPAEALLGRARRAPRAARLPRPVRRGRDRRRTDGRVVRGERDGVHPGHHRHREGPRRRVRGDRRGPVPGGGVRRDRRRLEALPARPHVGWGAALVRGRARGPRGPAVRGTRRPRARTGRSPARRARGVARGHPDGGGGPRARLPPRRARSRIRATGRVFLPPRAAASPAGSTTARVRARPHHAVDAAHPRRIRGRPDACSRRRSRRPTRSSPRWSPASPRRSAPSARRSRRELERGAGPAGTGAGDELAKRRRRSAR